MIAALSQQGFDVDEHFSQQFLAWKGPAPPPRPPDCPRVDELSPASKRPKHEDGERHTADPEELQHHEDVDHDGPSNSGYTEASTATSTTNSRTASRAASTRLVAQHFARVKVDWVLLDGIAFIIAGPQWLGCSPKSRVPSEGADPLAAEALRSPTPTVTRCLIIKGTSDWCCGGIPSDRHNVVLSTGRTISREAFRFSPLHKKRKPASTASLRPDLACWPLTSNLDGHGLFSTVDVLEVHCSVFVKGTATCLLLSRIGRLRGGILGTPARAALVAQ
jgi:hypothetical protein